MSEPIHKRASRSWGRGPLSVCGAVGQTTHFWKTVTCIACLRLKK